MSRPDSLWWLWLLLALLAIAGIVWYLIAAARRRKWDAAFALALTEARWAADSLAPSLLDRAVSGEVLGERWRGNQRRLDELQTELTRLADSAAGAERSARVARVSGATDALRQTLASDVALRLRTELPGHRRQTSRNLKAWSRTGVTRFSRPSMTAQTPSPHRQPGQNRTGSTNSECWASRPPGMRRAMFQGL